MNVTFLVGVALAGTTAIGDNDYGLHLRLGKEVLAGGAPDLDYHSYTSPGAEYPDHEWLSQAALFLAQSHLGDPGMVVLQACLVAATMGFVVSLVRGAAVGRLGAGALAFLLSLHHVQMRPHLLAWVFTALLVVWLDRRTLWPVPLLLLLWSNCHGSIPLAVGVVGLWCVEQFVATRKAAYAGLAVAACTLPLLNPHGSRVYSLFFEISGSTSFIGEWQPYRALSGAWWVLVAMLALAGIGVALNRPFSPFDAVRVMGLGMLALSSSRHGVVAALYLSPILGRTCERLVLKWRTSASAWLATALALVPLATFGVECKRGDAPRFEIDHELLPVESLDFVKRHALAKELFNDYNFGGWILWKGWPDYPVFIDGRTEVFHGAVLERYLAIAKASPGFDRSLEEYGVRTVVIRPERELTRALLVHPRWELAYFDYNSVIFVKRGTSPQVRRVRAITPFGRRPGGSAEQALSDVDYLISENPRFFGGHKIRAFLLAEIGDVVGASRSLEEYLRLHPEGRYVEETRALVRRLAASSPP